ncbi:MAG: hypothetical protein K2W95_01205 [Candidatus Obscuribacterales bacterium]|nr:hypothetical protein [Candidatus Obscuribacterales bacterium]
MNPRILSTDERVFYFPVRHHSPAAALLIEDYILKTRPAAVLIEGPADFNSQMSQLALPHKLPIAIYSYTMLSDESRMGVFYPFCEYSPEWRSILAGKALKCPVSFIDMPWCDLAFPTSRKNRYSDAALLRSDYIGTLCEKFGVVDFHDLWDNLFEIDPNLDMNEYLKRCHHLCYHMRLADGAKHEDILREAYMANEINKALNALSGQVVVVTGGFHSYALFARVNNLVDEMPWLLKLDKPDAQTPQGNLTLAPGEVPIVDEPAPPDDDEGDIDEVNNENEDNDFDFEDAVSLIRSRRRAQGISLTPYSYERLDSLTGYEAGMPGPGFYHEAFVDRQEGNEDTYRKLLFKAVTDLRQRKQQISSADVIAVESTAAGLAALRGHKRIWRRDLLDGITGALVKDELSTGIVHPLQQAVDKIMRGNLVGRLAEGTALPPLVLDIQSLIRDLDLLGTSEQVPRPMNLDLQTHEDRVKSCTLHRLSCLNIPGFNLRGKAADFMDDTSGKSIEHWEIKKHPQFESACIEASIYGSTLSDASAFKLVEKTSAAEGDAGECAFLLMYACLMGFSNLSGDFCERLQAAIAEDSQLPRLTRALQYMLYLYRYDDVLKEKPVAGIGELLRLCFDRCVWILDSTGSADQTIGSTMRTILETFERCHVRLDLDRNYFVDVLNRIRMDSHRDAILRGAATGSLWTLDEAPPESVVADMGLFSNPEQIGDFLTGLFLLAKEPSRHRKDLLLRIDQLLMSFTTEDYLVALPHLRLAFAVFTPREKFHMARLVMSETGSMNAPMPELDLDVAEAAMMIESLVKETLKKFGLRGLDSDG